MIFSADVIWTMIIRQFYLSLFKVLSNFQRLEININVAMPINSASKKRPFSSASTGPLITLGAELTP